MYRSGTSRTGNPWFFAVSVAFCGLVLLCLIYQWFRIRANRKNSFKTEEIRKTPKVFAWQRHIETTVRVEGNFRIECRDFRRKYHYVFWDRVEQTQEAINWIQEMITRRYSNNETGLSNVTVPKTACIISVPMENFKCGKTCTEFLPISEERLEGYHTYQLCGDRRFQVVRFVEDGIAYVIGYCIYIEDAYSRKENYREMHIENCYGGPEFGPATLNGEVRGRRGFRKAPVLYQDICENCLMVHKKKKKDEEEQPPDPPLDEV